jgi:hypothetical protein
MNILDADDITVNNITFDIKKNVKNVSMDIFNGNKTYSFYEEEINESTANIFFLFETPIHEAFGHWVFESSIFLPYVKEFTQLNNFYVLINKNNERKYKKLFLQLFDILDKNVHYINNTKTYTTDICYESIPENNICIVCRNYPLNQSCQNLTDTMIEKYKLLLDNFYHESIVNVNNISKEIEHLFLPRSKSGNFAPNDRQINYDVIYNLLKDKEYMTYDTIETNNFIDQIKFVQNSKNIYTNWGSSMLVNGFFSRNSNIYILNKDISQMAYVLLKIIVDIIEENNTVIYI